MQGEQPKTQPTIKSVQVKQDMQKSFNLTTIPILYHTVI